MSSISPFSVCIADPAWQYDQRGVNGAADKQYMTMPLDEMLALGPLVSSVMADDAILLVWGTWPLLKEAIQFVEACGFSYKTCGGLWVKTNKSGKGFFFGSGFYVRSNSEYVLLGTRGKPNVASHSVRQILVDPVSEHSKKPQAYHKRVEQLVGDVSKLEIFARRETPGWTCLGNEIDGRDLRESLPALKKGIANGCT